MFLPDLEAYDSARQRDREFAACCSVDAGLEEQLAGESALPLLVMAEGGAPEELLSRDAIQALTGAALEGQNYMELKAVLKKRGISVNTFESSVPWEEFKLNGDG